LHGGSHVGGWTAKQIHHAVLTSFHLSDSAYGLNQLGYDLRKLKGHGLLQRDGSRYAYRLTAFLKQYEKFFTFLRNELVSNNLADFRLKKGLDHLGATCRSWKMGAGSSQCRRARTCSSEVYSGHPCRYRTAQKQSAWCAGPVATRRVATRIGDRKGQALQ
jgi:hypothetical protein